MNILIIVILVIIAAVVVFSLLRSVIKALLFALGVGVLLLLIIGIIAYSDIRQASDILTHGEKTIIYADGDTFLAGVHAQNDTSLGISSTGRLSVGVESLNDEQLDEAKVHFEKGEEYSHSITIIIDNEWLWKSLESIEVYNRTLTQEEAENILTNKIFEGYEDIESDELKSTILLATLHDAMELGGTKELLAGLHNKQIQTSQHFISLGILQLLPEDALGSALKNSLTIRREDTKEQ